LSSKYPTIVEFVSCSRWQDGEERVPGSLTLYCQEGAFKCTLREKTLGLVGFVSGKTFTALLHSIETALAKGTVEWRVDAYAKKGKGGKAG